MTLVLNRCYCCCVLVLVRKSCLCYFDASRVCSQLTFHRTTQQPHSKFKSCFSAPHSTPASSCSPIPRQSQPGHRPRTPRLQRPGSSRICRYFCGFDLLSTDPGPQLLLVLPTDLSVEKTLESYHTTKKYTGKKIFLCTPHPSTSIHEEEW